MRQSVRLLFALILVSCTTTGVTKTPVVVVNTEVRATATIPSPTATSVPLTEATVTLTPEIACDPFTIDFCITDGHFILQRPILPPGNDLVDPTYRYGSTAGGAREPHHGVEFSNSTGTPIHAAADGRVIFAGPDLQAIYAPWGNFYGNLVVIEHSDDLFTLYAHLSRIDVSMQQKVMAGNQIGQVGRTGGAIGSHLHFEVRRGDVEDYFAAQNPELWLAPAKDPNGTPFGTLMVSVLNGDGKMVEKANFTIGYYSNPSQGPTKVYYATSYSPDLLLGEENAALGELPAGQYRIAVEMNGQILERWVEVQSGRLTQVAFVVK